LLKTLSLLAIPNPFLGIAILYSTRYSYRSIDIRISGYLSLL